MGEIADDAEVLKKDAENKVHDEVHALAPERKTLENEAKQHINSIWQKIENDLEWSIEKIEALIADLKKHL